MPLELKKVPRVRVPLSEEDILRVAHRMQSNRRGQISYQELATTVRNRIREDRLITRRQEIIEKKKKEERRRILQSDKPLNAPSNVTYLPTLYSMFGQRERSGHTTIISPTIAGSFSRRGSIFTPLPSIRGEGRDSSKRRSPMSLLRQGLQGDLSSFPGRTKSRTDSRGGVAVGKEAGQDNQGAGSSYVNQLRRQQTGGDVYGRHKYI
ncbi:uncharacterized protein LOC118477152 [Aplysia californica]|uniref:Uncharacterized protein LOC118477152 n=1 Tax=Aplysia californica TaxID=6500 RepID=A0ABM1VRE3_APLCA|nr:uncharacterized protein LOC118477152 [Aplysia californica]